MAGGVALNCVANGRVIRETPIKKLFVQPAAGDAGGAVGVAHYLYNTLEKQPRGKAWTHAYLGPEYSDAEIAQYLEATQVPAPPAAAGASCSPRPRACSRRAT